MRRLFFILLLLTLSLSAMGQMTVQEALKKANAGDVEAQFSLAHAYYNGSAGLTQSYTEAIKWFKKAAAKGHTESMYCLYLCYSEGQAAPVDNKEAMKWLTKAAEIGDKESQYALGVHYDLGDIVAQSYSNAAKWYKKAADQGHTSAMVDLGILYLRGNGVAESHEKAENLFRKAADLGNLTALYNLGLYFAKHYDYEDGLPFFQEAAEKGHIPSMYELGWYYKETENYAKAIPWLRKAADQGDVDAMADLGECYWLEAETVSELEQALYWLRKAESLGNEGATDIIAYAEDELKSKKEEEAKKAEESRRNAVRTSSVPSAGYSRPYRSRSFNTPYWDERPWGFTIGYVQKQWSYKPRPEFLSDYGDVEELYGVFSDEGEATSVSGLQMGLRYEPQFGGGFGLDTGLYYEFYTDHSMDYYDDDGYEFKSVWEEHSLNIPLHLEFRANFSEGFQIFAYGGASVDLGLSSTYHSHYYYDDWDSDKFNAYGREYEMLRYNASWEAGAGVRFNGLQIQWQMSRGLIDMAQNGAEYTVFQNKPMTLTLSWMF